MNYIAAIFITVAFGVSTIKFMHFFQLNSYKIPTQLLWIKKNKSRLFANIFFPIISALSLLLKQPARGICISAVFIAAIFYVRPVKNAKKPLVYTKRVNRMLLTTAILYVTIAYFAFTFTNIPVFLLVVMFILSPFSAILANLINKPFEKAINNSYINDAKRLLNRCNNLTVIGVTGSYGKTSVKYYLKSLLQAKYNVLMTPESYNTPMGVVKTIRESLNATHEIFICEMGAKHVGDVKEICDIVRPKHGVITSVGPQHLETFKSIDNVLKTKFELSDSLASDGILFINGDDENIKSFNKRQAVSYSIRGNGSYNATNISVSEAGTSFTVTAPNGESCEFSTKLIGSHNVLNIVGAIAVANTLNIPLSELKLKVKRLEGVPHRLELIKKGNITIIDDAYNSNPNGTKAALEVLGLMQGAKILVTPGMVELGEKQNECNFEFGKNAAAVCDWVVLVGKHQTESILEGLRAAGYAEKKIFVANSLGEAMNYVYALNTGDDKKIILLENDLPDNY